MPGLGQGMTQGRNDQSPRNARIAKPNLGFGRMHVHVHQRGVTIQKQRCRRVPVAGQEIEIGCPQGPAQHLVTHGTSVDEQILRHRRAPRIGWKGGIAKQANTVTGGVDAQCVIGKVATQDAPQPLVQRIEQIAVLRVRAKHNAAFATAADIAQSEPDGRLCHGQPLDHIGDRLCFGAVGAHEFQPCGRGIEQIAQIDDRSRAQRRRLDRAGLSCGDPDAGSVSPGNPAGDGQPPDSPQRGQGLATKSKGVNIQQVRTVDFRCRMA